MPEDYNPNDPRLFMAAERTFLAWVRTGVALMGLGFVVARFGVFLRETESGGGADAIRSGWSVHFGAGLLLLGVAVNVISVFTYTRLVQALKRGERIGERPSGWGIGFALLQGGIGIALAIYLFFSS